MSSTMRLFVNDNRISTAVKVKSGSVLQVYPVKITFSDVTKWREHWENELKPKITIKMDDEVAPAPAPAPAPIPVPAPAPKVKKAKLSDWNITKGESFKKELPAGKYYIGDLCYVLGDDVYDNIFGGTGYSSGIYTKNTGETFLVSGTAWGDGEYRASDGRKFAVDAGIIGICSTSLMAKDDGGGHIYNFKESVECKFGGGRFFFNSGYRSLVIDTTGDDDNEYSDDDY